LNSYLINGRCLALLPCTTTPSTPPKFLHRVEIIYPAIIMYRKITGHAADKTSAAITDTKPTFDVPCGPRQRSTRSVVANIIIIPCKAPSQSRAIFLVFKASSGLMTSKDVSTCVMMAEDKFAPILLVGLKRRGRQSTGVVFSDRRVACANEAKVGS
jgi:hypothetical protein